MNTEMAQAVIILQSFIFFTQDLFILPRLSQTTVVVVVVVVVVVAEVV